MEIPKTSYQKPGGDQVGVPKEVLHLENESDQKITYQNLVRSLSNALHQDPLQNNK